MLHFFRGWCVNITNLVLFFFKKGSILRTVVKSRYLKKKSAGVQYGTAPYRTIFFSIYYYVRTYVRIQNPLKK